MAERSEDTFAELVRPHRAELHAHCYRMLGSAADADDAMQETLLRAWRGLPRFEGRSSLRSWLYTIATNVCLRHIERRPKRVLPIDYGPPSDPHDELGTAIDESRWVDPYPDHALGLTDSLAGPEARYEQRESLELAFVAALHHLPVRQRAALILRDVLGFSGEETAAALDTTPTSVYSLLQRAHRTVDTRLPAQSQLSAIRALGDDGTRQLVGAYVDAWERGDVDAVVALLTDDVTLTMPPISMWFEGLKDVATFLSYRPLADGRRWRVVPTQANGQLAFGFYVGDEDGSTFVAHGLNVVAVRGDAVSAITAYLTPEVFDRFGLPNAVQR